MARHLLALKPQQKTLAALLALGVPAELAAKQLGVSKVYVETLLKGGLFQFEIDEARDRLIGERLREYNKLLSDELLPNIETLKSIRDNSDDEGKRLRAIELMLEYVAPKPRQRDGAEVKVRAVLTTEQARQVRSVLTEATPISNDDDSSDGSNE